MLALMTTLTGLYALKQLTDELDDCGLCRVIGGCCTFTSVHLDAGGREEKMADCLSITMETSMAPSNKVYVSPLL